MAKRSTICQILKRLNYSNGGNPWQKSLWSGRNISTLAYEEIVIPSEGGGEAANLGISSWKRAIVMHGLMGSGRNWKSFSKNLANDILRRSPFGSSGWRMVLVDLRNHGRSAGLEGFNPPHDISSAARDVANLVKAENWASPDVVIGHSMGGKVALEYAQCCSKMDYGDSVTLPKQLWVLDSVPGEVKISNNDAEVEKVLSTLKLIPLPIPSRRWLTEHMMKLGFSKTLCDWLASNLKRVHASNEEVTWVFDLDAIFQMFDSYRRESYWSLLQNVPDGLELSIVRAKNSDRWSPIVLSQLQALANKQEKAKSGKLLCHVLEDAGHWLHTDNPKGLIDIMSPALVRLSTSSP